jgi:hypothetical protein
MVMDQMQGLGYGIISIAVLLGIGIYLLSTMGTTLSTCGTGYTYQANSSGTTYTTQLCCNSTGPNCTGTNSQNPSLSTQNLNTMYTYLGTTNGGLASWIPLIIILVVGMFFLGAFMVRKGRSA